jgi:hypothetical protein
MECIHQPVTEPRWEETNERIVRNPIKARKIPKISSFRSLEILFHCQADFEDERRVLLVLEMVFDLGLEDRVGVVLDFVLDPVGLELDFLLLETGFCAKSGLQNGKVVLIITNSVKRFHLSRIKRECCIGKG